MRKVLSSFFILSLLLISLWGISAWLFGEKYKNNLQNLFYGEIQSQNHFLINEFEYELFDIKHSIFGTKAKIAIEASLESQFSFIGLNNEDKLILSVESYNGPVFFDKSGISTGSSIWYVRIDQELNNKTTLDKLNFKQLPTVVFKVGFDENIEYKSAIETNFFELVLDGVYDSKVREGFGEIAVNNFNHQTKQQKIKSKDISFGFKHSNIDSKASTTDVTVDIPQILYQHQSMSKPIYLNVNGNGKISIDNNTYNSKHSISFEQIQNLYYPLTNGELELQISDLSFKKLQSVSNGFSKLENLQQQIEWILEDQAEVPEGQDKIWQLQDSVKQLKMNLPLLTNELLVKNNKSLVNFSLNTNHQNKVSTLIGEILPLSQRSLDSTYITSTDSLITLFKAEAEVNLNKELLDLIAKHLPIKNKRFGLIYKQNKLLMQ